MPTKIKEAIHFFESVKEIPQSDWNVVIPKYSVYLSLPYLTALEETLKGTIKPIYVLVYNSEGKPMLAGMFQIATFTYKKTSQQNLFIKLFQDCRNEDDSFSIKGLVCGNMFGTGENGFAHNQRISKRTAIDLMASAAKEIKNNKRWEDLFSVLLFKDFSRVYHKAMFWKTTNTELFKPM